MTAQGTPSAGFDAGALHATIVALARPRMTGSAGGREIDARIRRRFRELGYDVRALPFSFSTLPGRYGLPLAGAILLATTVGAGALLPAGRSAAALGTLAAGLALAVLPLLLLDPAIRRLPWGRVETANLLFTRATPRWLVMAHRDTKSQWAPTLVRTVALAAALAGWVALVAIALAGLPGAGPVPGAGWVRGGATVLAGGAVVLLLSPAANRSPGALDNGSGLAALLAVAERAPADVAFLVTDGEELGLAGARAAVGRLPDVAGIVNLDGLDDRGPLRIAEGRGGGRRGPAGALAAALLEEARALGLAAVRRPLPPFVMVDHEPLARAGLPALTVLKGRWRSLLRVHRPADTPDRITGAGAAEAATVVLNALRRPPAGDRDTLRPDERSGHSPPP